MKILLDECIPLPASDRLSDLPHTIHHATRVGFAGVTNGALYEGAIGRYDLLVSSDRHFRNASRFAVRADLGIVFVRIVPTTTELVVPALRRLLAQETPEGLIGHRIILRRDEWEIREQ